MVNRKTCLHSPKFTCLAHWEGTVNTPTSNCALWTRQIYMHNQVVYHAASFLLLQGSCMYLMFRCNLTVYMDAVNSQSSNLLRRVHAGQGNCISEYLDSGPPYKLEKSQLPCKATGVMLQDLFINILINVPYVMGSWLTTWSIVAKIGECNKSHLCPYS